MESVAIIFTVLSGVIVFVAVAAILRGWALSILWSWFLAPLGAPELSIPVAIGVSLIVGFLTHQHPREKDASEWSDTVARLAGVALSPLVVVGLGWIVKQFI